MPHSRASRVHERLVESVLRLEQLERHRLIIRDPDFGKAEQRRIVNREILEMELQAIEEEIESICEKAASRIPHVA